MLVNGEFVDDQIVRIEAAQLKEQLLAGMPTDGDRLGVELRARDLAKERVIERTLLRQEACKDPTPIPPDLIEVELKRHQEQNPQATGCLLPRDMETLRTEIETDLRLRRFVGAIIANVPKPTATEVKALYRNARESLTVPESVRVAHIVKNVDESTSEEEALRAIQQIESLLEQGASFEQVADEHSDCPGRGGDLGHLTRGEMVEEFDAHVFDLPVGAVSKVFRTPFGFHIAKVLEREGAHLPTLAEVRADLEQSMWLREKKAALSDYMERVRQRAEVRRSR